MWRKSLKLGCNSRSFPANFWMIFFPFLITCLATTGIKMASMFSEMFSNRAEYPCSMQSSRSLLVFFWPILKILRLLDFSFSLIQTTPCN